MELKECGCKESAPEIKLSIGPYNDHFHFIECQSCRKRTKGMWRKEDAANEWNNDKLVNKG